MEKRKVLFLCTGNSCRSQMAEAIVNARLGAGWEAVSAGTIPAGYVHPKALAALHEIEGHLISGSILACLTVLLFMKSWRSTLIASVAIPTSIIATFAVMGLFGFTLNNVTMLALVLMVGVVIDDAIVVLENAFRFIEEKGMPPAAATIIVVTLTMPGQKPEQARIKVD